MHWEGSAEYDEATDTFTFRDSESEEPEIVKGVGLDGEHVYPIGSHAWTWSEADAVPETQEERAHVTLDRVVKRLREVETFLASLHDEGKGGETAFGEMRAEVAKAIEEIESVECYS